MNSETVGARVSLRPCFSTYSVGLAPLDVLWVWQADNWRRKAENVVSGMCWGIRAVLGSVCLGSVKSKRKSDADVAGGDGLSLLIFSLQAEGT